MDHYQKDDSPVRVDALEQFWYLEKLRVSFRAPSDVVDEAIGKYQADQRGSWIRTFNPLYWFGRLIDWPADLAFEIVRRFRPNLQQARRPFLRRTVEAIVAFFGLIAAACTILWFLGYQTAVQHFLHLS